MILALGLSRFSRRRFLLFDSVACALWAAIYAAIGSIGGRVASQPVWGMIIAIGAALTASLMVQQVRRMVRRHQQARQLRADDVVDTDGEPDVTVTLSSTLNR